MPIRNHVRELWQFFEVYTDAGATLECKLVRTDIGLELRLQSWSLPPERVQQVGSYGDARHVARQWLEEVATKVQEPLTKRAIRGWWRTTD